MVWEYIKSCTLKVGFLTLLFSICYSGCGVGANIWLAKWSTDEDEEAGNMSLTTLVKLTAILHNCCISQADHVNYLSVTV